MINAGIVGANGFTGQELLRILSHHPAVDSLHIVSRALDEDKTRPNFQSFKEVKNLNFVTLENLASTPCDIVFFATPHGVAMEHADRLINNGLKVIDLSADFRIEDPGIFEKWYNITHKNKDLLSDAVYGLPEINREKIKISKLIAMPGCYPTAVILGLYPLLKNGIIKKHNIIADCKSGVSGAGKNPKDENMFSEISENFRPYGLDGHRHWPEIYQELCSIISNQSPRQKKIENLGFIFSPNLVPMFRGILATIYCYIEDSCLEKNIYDVFNTEYSQEPFVDILPSGSCLDTASVKGSNRLKIALRRPKTSTSRHDNSLIVYVAEDNLMKGASGQAVQVMNIILNIDEKTGLNFLPFSR
uniref:N-acetyl-gamma-glutamyl-phosphate reductase n=1 Tax=uncultured beta proteobacterium HF0130_04F21 TaxID=710819 RepID=E0XSR8_9PROT|nr:acetylglutamate semialdehyde dehydrogenase [uncultured beta proteobacterium HF0130_04F21]